MIFQCFPGLKFARCFAPALWIFLLWVNLMVWLIFAVVYLVQRNDLPEATPLYGLLYHIYQRHAVVLVFVVYAFLNMIWSMGLWIMHVRGMLLNQTSYELMKAQERHLLSGSEPGETNKWDLGIINNISQFWECNMNIDWARVY